MALSLKELKNKMVPASAHTGSAEDSQYLSPSEYDKKARREFKLDVASAETVADHEEMNKSSENFTVQDKIKKNTKAPLREYAEEGAVATKASVGGDGDVKVNIAYEEEALDLLEEITGLVERLEFDHGYFWQDVASHLKNARNCLLRQPLGESVVSELDEEQLEEAFKRGNFKLRDGSQIKLTKEDVEALNAAVAGTKNATKLVSEITENQKEFSQFLSFAKNLDEGFDAIVDGFLAEATEEQIRSMSDGDVDLQEIWAHAKAGARNGAVIGKNVGAIAGTVYGAAAGATIGGAIGAAKAAPKIKDIVNKWNARKDDQPTPSKPTKLGHVTEEELSEEENHYVVTKRSDGKWGVGQKTKNGLWYHDHQTGGHKSKDDAVSWVKKRIGNKPHKLVIKEDPGGDDDDNEDEPLGYDQKASILGTSAPAMDSHLRKDKMDVREEVDLQEAKKEGYQRWPGDKKKSFYLGPKDKDGKTETQKWLEKKRAAKEDTKEK